MDITFIVPELNPTGGIRVISIYARELKRRGHDVLVIKWKPSIEGVRNRIRHFLKPAQNNARDWYFEDGNIAIQDFGYSRTIDNNRIRNSDVVIATWYHTADAVAKLAPEKGAKFYFMQDYGAPGQPLELLKQTWRYPMHFITISQFLARMIHEEQPQASITLVPNAVDTNIFSSPPRQKQRKPTFGLIYRSLRSKGADVALAAFRALREVRNDCKLLVASHDEVEETLPPGVVSFKGVSDTDLARIYGSCDAWLFPSRAEGFGLPILEAMACRTPVISTPTGAAPELLADAGMLVPVDDPSAMTAAMQSIIAMSEKDWAELSERAYRRAIGWTWTDAVDRFEAALKQGSAAS